MTKSGLFITAVLIAGAAVFVSQLMRHVTPIAGVSTSRSVVSDVADGSAIAQVVVPTGFSPNAQIGQRVFVTKCAVCHGTNAAGLNAAGPPLVHKIYEPSHHGDAAFLSAAKNGVRSHHWPFGNMPPVEGLTDADVKMVVVYIRELQQANGIY